MESTSAWLSPSATLTVTATVVVAASLISLGSSTLWPRRKVLPSPLKTLLPRLRTEEVEALAYHPAQFPGARDVQTPVCDTCAQDGWAISGLLD